jgi:hypothetical protein
MREATLGQATLSLAQQFALRGSGGAGTGPFGLINIEYGAARTLHEMAQRELDVVEELVGRVLPPSASPSEI